MWEARPAFVSDAPDRTQTAYAFALSRPDVLRWLPCYCGCGAMGHDSNLDCFIKPTAGAPIVYEEHGSYRDVCVDIAQAQRHEIAEGVLVEAAATRHVFAADVAQMGDRPAEGRQPEPERCREDLTQGAALGAACWCTGEGYTAVRPWT